MCCWSAVCAVAQVQSEFALLAFSLISQSLDRLVPPRLVNLHLSAMGNQAPVTD